MHVGLNNYDGVNELSRPAGVVIKRFDRAEANIGLDGSNSMWQALRCSLPFYHWASVLPKASVNVIHDDRDHIVQKFRFAVDLRLPLEFGAL